MAFAFDYFPELETEHLLLREITAEDADDVYALFADPEVTRYYDLATLMQPEEAIQLIDFFAESFDEERSIRWGIVRKEDDRLVGTCGFVALWEHRGEIGYDLAPSLWGQGIMAEALEAVLEFGFDELALSRIEAFTMVENAASAALLRKLGFREEGILRDYDHFKGAFHDMRLCAMLRRDFYEK